MVRNVELYGAAAVVLFPDPNSYIISQDGVTGKYFSIIDLKIEKSCAMKLRVIIRL